MVGQYLPDKQVSDGSVDLVAEFAESPTQDVEGRKYSKASDLDVEHFPPSFNRSAGETKKHFVKRLLTEGHSIPDAFLSVAAAQIGQVMLTTPNALYKTGVAVGLFWSIFSALVSLWTMYMLSSLYLERKRILLKAGTWFDSNGQRKKITQYHEVVGFFLGKKAQAFAQLLIMLGLAGTAIAQVIACAGDMYTIDKSKNKRTWELIWGGVLMIFALVPTFRHFRVLNIVALIGTTYTAILVITLASQHGFANAKSANMVPRNALDFFTGGAVLNAAMGSHSIALEMMDAMQTSSTYMPAYTSGWLWTAWLVLPHSTLVNLSFGDKLAHNDNVYGLLPVSTALKVSVWLMVIHQFVAFALYVTPLLFMWEKAIGTHEKAWYIRLPSRVPIALLIWFLGVAFPFYGSINAIMAAISAPATAFVLPAVTYNLLYRSQAARDAAILPPSKRLVGSNGNWTGIFLVNWVIAALFAAFAVISIVCSIIKIVQNSYTFGVFAACYQCAA